MARKERGNPKLRAMMEKFGVKTMDDVSAIEGKVIFLYSQGVSTRDIQKTMQEMYGIDMDDSRVSKITDKLLPVIREWQERPLQSVYAMVILDAVHYSVQENGQCPFGTGELFLTT